MFFRFLNGLSLAVMLLAFCHSQQALASSSSFFAEPEMTGMAVDTNSPVSLVADINAGQANSSPSDLHAIGETLFFSATDAEHGRELWKSVPPYSSAKLVADINPGNGNSNPRALVSIGQTLFFIAENGKQGLELWKSDPPYTSALLVSDINPGTNGAFPRDYKTVAYMKREKELVPMGTTLIFAADDGKTGEELWKSEPPYDANTTTRLSDIRLGGEGSSPHEFTTMGWILFFVADDGTNRSELYKTELPYSSVQRVSNIYPAGNAKIAELAVIDSTLFFSARDKTSGQELWKTVPPYGFENATRITDLTGSEASLSPVDLLPIGNAIFFSGYHVQSGYELWKSDPPYEATSTYRIGDVMPGNKSKSTDPDPENEKYVNAIDKFAIGETLIFRSFEQGSGMELYRIDPPYKGEDIKRIAEVNKNPVTAVFPYGGSYPDEMTLMGSTLFFTASDFKDKGREIWSAQPPYYAVENVTDLMPGIQDSNPYGLTVVGRTMFFAAGAKGYGIELWKYESSPGYLPNSGFAPGKVTEVLSQPDAKSYSSLGDLWLEIPSTGVQAAIAGVPLTSDGWDVTWLGQQAGYLSDTAFPTHQGNTVITAHSYLADGTPGPFIDLQKLKWGDKIFIHAWGLRYIYEVRSAATVAAEDMSVMGHKNEDWVTLITCKEFDSTQNKYNKRIVIQAVRISIVEDTGVVK